MNQDTCIGPECEREQLPRSVYCIAHRRQERLGKDLKPLRLYRLTPEERFWSKVNKDGPTPATFPELGACWVWTDALNNKGYGKISLPTHKFMQLAHRVSYEWVNGPVPDGMVIDHICHNTACVRPTHLRPATNKQNVEYRKGSQRNNRSGYRGVSWSSRDNDWRATVNSGGRHYYLGSFDDPREAHLAVVAKRRELHEWDAPDNYAA